MSTPELLPCPWCGGPAEYLQMSVSMVRARCAGRETCHVAPSAPAFFTKEATAQLWNRRRPPVATPSGVAAEAIQILVREACALLVRRGLLAAATLIAERFGLLPAAHPPEGETKGGE